MTAPDRTIEISLQGQRRIIRPGEQLLVGRVQPQGLSIDDPLISQRHVVVWFDGVWRVRGEGRNGTFRNGQRVEELAITDRTVLTLAGPSGPELVLVPSGASSNGPPAAPPSRPAQPFAPPPGPGPASWPVPQVPHAAPAAPSWPVPPYGVPPPGPGTFPARPFAPPAQFAGPYGPPAPPAAPPVSAPLAPPPAGRPSIPPPPLPVGPNGQPDLAASAIHPILKEGLTVGRAPDNTVVVDDLLVSRHHATVRFDGRAWWLSDLNSANGTYVDGSRVSSQQIFPNNLIGIGHQTFRLVDGKLAEYQDTGAITFEARELYVVAEQRRILDNVSFVLEPNTMMVIVGPSGSGKSTLLKALTGTSPASYGQVGYGGRDLYSNFDEIRHRIGFVPQDDILHPQLHVQEALDYAGRLRFPQDVNAQQRAVRVGEVIAELGLAQQAGQRISTLSGGQRKRTSTAMELLTRPSLLFLDEPTSGLDINRDREVMQVLRKLADGGRTVVVVSHNVTYLNLADRILILATGGQLAYYGPPDGALKYFGVEDYADMYALLEQPRRDWRERFEQSPAAAVVPKSRRAPIAGKSLAPHHIAPNTQQNVGMQFATLCRRYLAVIFADKQFVILMIAMPLMLALFAHTVPGSAGLSFMQTVLDHSSTKSPGQLLLVLIVGGCLIGSASSVREIVKERPIYEREKAIGLSWAAYLSSKVFVLSAIVGVQAIVLTLLGLAGDPGPDKGVVTDGGTFELIIAMILVTIASMCLGLILSVLVSNADRAMPLLVLVIMAQLLMSGGLFPVKGRPVLEQVSWLMPARWGFAAGASDVGLPPIGDNGLDPLWKHTSGAFFADVFVLIALTAAYVIATAVLLRRIGRLRFPNR